MNTPNFMGETMYWFMGVVEDNNDPYKLGRAKVRIIGAHTDNKSLLPTSKLPWAHPIMPITSPCLSGVGDTPCLIPGTWVVGFFRDGASKQQPVVFGTFPGLPQAASVPSQGFNDPTGTYPTSDNVGKSDINRLARNDEPHPVITKKSGVKLPNPLPNGQFWIQPEISYGAKYPNNRVLETKSGHIVELDDTPNNERVHVYHKSGTNIEIGPDGTRVDTIKGSSTTLTTGDNNQLVGKTANLTILAGVKTLVNNNVEIEVVGGSVNINIIGGGLNITATGNIVSNITGNIIENITGSKITNISGDHTITTGGTVTVTGATINLN